MSEEIKRIRILLYRTPWKLKLKYLVNWLISIRTWSKWSHIEAWTANEDGKFFEMSQGTQGNVESNGSLDGQSFTITMPTYEWSFLGTCYTSTMRGEDNGTVKRDASEVLDHPENWDYIEVEVEAYQQMMLYMNNQVGSNKGYGNWDILKFVSPIHFDDKGRNICSEFVNNALFFGLVLKGYGIVSPNAVAKKLLKLGYKVKSLKG
jgi:hypothetical protein